MGSLRMSLDAVPADVEPAEIEKVILDVAGVESVHHMHIWAMSTTQNAMTTHIVLSETLSFDEKMKLVHQIKHELLHNNIHHATIELESAAMPCGEKGC
jgi:cobalt-zinc-cadmium efflux system protein